jgi:hypothetical protein
VHLDVTVVTYAFICYIKGYLKSPAPYDVITSTRLFAQYRRAFYSKWTWNYYDNVILVEETETLDTILALGVHNIFVNVPYRHRKPPPLPPPSLLPWEHLRKRQQQERRRRRQRRKPRGSQDTP